jgi:ADP-ribose pyrophosphatase YjhB (NUDIX family)
MTEEQSNMPIRTVVPPVPPPIRIPPATVKKAPKTAVKAVKARKRKRAKPAGRQKVRHELSAGGVVVREENGRYLVALLKTEHKRGEVWVLPKGHVELATRESVSDAAKREVQEEAGISDLSIKDELGITRFRFQAEDAVVKKTVHYFLMTTNQFRLTPQAEEGLLEAAWFPIDEALKNLAYDTDRDIVARAQERLNNPGSAHRSSRQLRIHT